jgi:hypothetical protein
MGRFQGLEGFGGALDKIDARSHIALMSDEILKPEAQPRAGSHASSPLGCLLAAAGATLLALTKLGAGMAATIWAISKLLELPDMAMFVLMGLGAVPVLWATIWTAGRAWHVERRLAAGLDIDQPVFRLTHYWRRAGV